MHPEWSPLLRIVSVPADNHDRCLDTIFEGCAGAERLDTMGLPEARDDVIDICVVGAGPHGLAFLTHLLSQPEHLDHFDEHPHNATLYSHSRDPRRVRCKLRDAGALRSKRSNHELYRHFISRSSTHKTRLSLHQGVKVMANEGGMRVCVMDRCGEAFLRKWDTHFEVLDIPFLRSTTHQHPDPLDLGLLSAFAHHTKRYHELVPLKLTGSVEDVDQRRQGAFRGPYLRPTTALFRDFVQGLVKGFHLDGAVNHAEISKLEPLVDGSRIFGFRVTYSRGDQAERVVHAKRVVLALGHANLVSIPDWAVRDESSAPKSRLLHYEDLITAMAEKNIDIKGYFHSLFQGAPSAPLKGMRVLIVGGGQTSVHLAQLAVSKLGSNPRDITFLTRSALRSQPFDVSLQWLSTTRYESLAGFWSADHRTRARMLREAKGSCGSSSGASVDAECVHWLRSSGIHVKQQCEVLSATWNSSASDWRVELWDDLNFHDEVLACDVIWLATGNAMDFLHEPVVNSLRSALDPLGMAIQTQGKLPVLGEDLSLSFTGAGVRCEEGVAVHVMGAYAALELGPGALNLMGARAGACRISRAVRRDLHAT